MIHDFDTSRRALEDSIRDLSATGWTPLGGVLEFSAGLVADLDPPREGDLAPVIYLLSDGEEACEGDPVAAAARLYEAGAQTAVNTIGFDVSAETAAQLEAIAEAAGGVYYPAQDANGLRNQLQAIKDSENALARYQYCVNLNAGRIGAVYHNARIALAGCYQRNNPQNRQLAVLNFTNKAREAEAPEAACADMMRERVNAEVKPVQSWLTETSRPLTDDALRLIEEYRGTARLSDPDPAE